MVRPVLLAAMCCLYGCNGKTAQAPARPERFDATVATPTGHSAECDALADKVAGIYREQLTDPVENEIEDATAMILGDCRKDPDQFAPCIGAATTVAQLESECVIPLDDAGTVEGAFFRAKAAR